MPGRVNIENPSSGFKLSDVIAIEGFTSLKVGNMQDINRFREASMIIFKDGKVIVFDNGSDFQNIWVFDQKTGSNMLRVEHPFHSREMADIDIDHRGGLCGNFYRFNDASRDYLSGLLKYGRLFSRDQSTFSFYLTAPQLNSLIEKKMIDMTGLEQYYPKLHDVLKNIDPEENKNPLILYLSFKTEIGKQFDR